MAVLALKARDLAARLPPLLVAAQRVAQTVRQGVHGRRRAGAGESFWQFRRYAPGDPATRIDWRQSARTDKLFVREREYEAAQTVQLWADASGSMHYASQPGLPTKLARAQLLTLALSLLLQRGGERLVWLRPGGNRVIEGAAGIDDMAAQFDSQGKEQGLPVLTGRHTHMVLCSDFLMPAAALRQLIGAASAAQAGGALVHIIDPLEDAFDLAGRVELQGCEGDGKLILPDAAALRDAYQARMAAHKEMLRQMAAGAGWLYLAQRTDAPPEHGLMALYQHLSERRR